MRVLIAEDHRLVREGIRNILIESGVVSEVGEASNGHEAVLKASSFKPDLVILDYEMPRYNAIYACNIMQERWPDVPLLIVSMYQSKENIIEAFKAGAKGIVYKEACAEELIEAVKTIMSSQTWFRGKVGEVIAGELSIQNNGNRRRKDDDLTVREKEIIGYLAKGYISSEISDMMFISKRTVEVHKSNIFKKLKVNNTTKLIRYVFENKLINFPDSYYGAGNGDQ